MPDSEDCEGQRHYFTPIQAKVRGAIQFCERMSIDYIKRDVFRIFNVSICQGYKFLRNESSLHRLRNDLNREETRGRLRVISAEKLREMKRILQEEGIEAHVMTQEQLGYKVGLEYIGEMVKNAIGFIYYRKCIAYKKGWVNERTTRNHKAQAEVMKERYPRPKDWHCMRFSDEVHFGYGPQGKLRIIRKTGEQYCPNCIQEDKEPNEKDKKCHHCWALMGYNFKSDIYFYKVPGNTNGKMSQKVYIDQILEPIVKPQIDTHHDFVLEEDGNLDHKPGKSNIVCTWKEANSLEFYFNCHLSLDLAPIENCWQLVKQDLHKYPHWDDNTTKELIFQRWTHISQHFINEKVASMPERLDMVITRDGKMTGY